MTDFAPLIWVQTPHQAENENGWARLRLIVRLYATYVCETGPGSGLCEVRASLAAGGSGRAGLEVGAQVPLRQASLRASPKKIAPDEVRSSPDRMPVRPDTVFACTVYVRTEH